MMGTLLLDVLFNWPGLFMGACFALLGAAVHRHLGLACLMLFLTYLALDWTQHGPTPAELDAADQGWIANMQLHSSVALAVLGIVGYGAGTFANNRIRV